MVIINKNARPFSLEYPYHYYLHRERVFKNYAEIDLSLFIHRQANLSPIDPNGDDFIIKPKELTDEELILEYGDLFLSNFIEYLPKGPGNGSDHIRQDKWRLYLGRKNAEERWEGVASRYVWKIPPQTAMRASLHKEPVTVRLLIPYNINDNNYRLENRCLDLYLDDEGDLAACEVIPTADLTEFIFQQKKLKYPDGSPMRPTVTRLIHCFSSHSLPIH